MFNLESSQYFKSLPVNIQEQINQSSVKIQSEEQLKSIGEYLTQNKFE